MSRLGQVDTTSKQGLGIVLRQMRATVATLLVYAIVFVVALTVSMYVNAKVDLAWSIFIGPLLAVSLLTFILPIIAVLTQVGSLMLLNFASWRPGPQEIMIILAAGVLIGGATAYAIGFIFKSSVVTFAVPGAIAGAAAALTLRWLRGPMASGGSAVKLAITS